MSTISRMNGIASTYRQTPLGRRAYLELRATYVDSSTCVACRAPILIKFGCRRRVYCSHACRTRAYRLRHPLSVWAGNQVRAAQLSRIPDDEEGWEWL